MTFELAPSILSFDLANLPGPLGELDSIKAPIVHLDVMDGQFVPPLTFGDAFVKSLRRHSSALFEAHLMIASPENQFEAFKEAGCGRIIFHVEATPHSYRLAQHLRELGMSPGVALNPGTPVEAALPLLDVVDLVLVMTVNPGWGGQKFLPRMLQKVEVLRLAKPELKIEVDGGIDPTTLPLAKEAGANVFVVGSYLAKAPDLALAAKGLMAQCV